MAAANKEFWHQNLTSHYTSPETPRSEDGTTHASGSNAHANISRLYSMVDGALNPTEVQGQAITELRQELAYFRRERDELQVNMERMIESPPKFDDEILSLADISRTSTLPRAAIYHQLTANIPPLTTIMQYYHALKGLNLLISRVLLLKPGTTLSNTQFEQVWEMADATARDTIAFMWVTGENKLPTGIMEVVTRSPPFYAGRFMLWESYVQ